LTIFVRPVYARARRMACIVASVPETVIRTLSTQPVSSLTSSARRTSSSVVNEKVVPRRMRWLT
jgi:hypothetical protein